MPILNNPRHERLAQELAKGVPAVHAYVTAGFKPNGKDRHRHRAAELARSAPIKSRVHEILGRHIESDDLAVERALRAGAMNRAEVLLELSAIGRSNLYDLLVEDAFGQMRLDLTRLTRLQASAIESVEIIEGVDPLDDQATVRRTRVKFHSKLDALDKLLRVMGAYQDKLKVTFGLDEIDEAIARMEERLAGRPPQIEHRPEQLAEVES